MNNCKWNRNEKCEHPDHAEKCINCVHDTQDGGCLIYEENNLDIEDQSADLEFQKQIAAEKNDSKNIGQHQVPAYWESEGDGMRTELKARSESVSVSDYFQAMRMGPYHGPDTRPPREIWIDNFNCRYARWERVINRVTHGNTMTPEYKRLTKALRRWEKAQKNFRPE